MLQRSLFNTDKLELARNVPLFAALPAPDREALLKDVCICTCRRKKTLFRQGDAATHFYVLCRGTVQLFYSMPNGSEVTVDILRPGDILAAAEILDPAGVHQTQAVAIDDVTVMEFPKKWLEEAMRQHGAVSSALLADMARRLRKTTVELARQATMPAAELLACYLRHLCDSHRLDPAGFDLPYSKTLIASRLGMELETLSRTLPRLKEHGISVRGNRVCFDDPPGAECRVCGCHAQKKDGPYSQSIAPKDTRRLRAVA